MNSYIRIKHLLPGHVAQSVNLLTADMCLTADPGVTSLILVRFDTFIEIDHDIFLQPFSSLQLIQEGLLSVKSDALINHLVKHAQEINMVTCNDLPEMTIAVD